MIATLGVASTQEPRRPAPDRAISGNGLLVAVVLAGYPVAWAIGLGPAVFPVAAVFMALWLARHRPLLIPPGTIILVLFLVLVLASIVQVESPGRFGTWVLRTSWYASAVICWLFLARQTSVSARRLILYALLAAWAITVFGGLAAMIVPELSWPTPLSFALPDIIAQDEYIRDLIQPRLAEIQTFHSDIRLDRPAAPYAYTNAWGSSMALLTPFALAALGEPRLRLPRWPVAVVLLIGLIPFAASLNRGAWLTLGLGLVYGIARYAAVTGNLKPMVRLVAIGTLVLMVAAGTGLLDTAMGQLATRTGDSNETRSGLYLETMEHSIRSPFIGYGTPRPNPSNPSGPPLGTHGQLWAVMFAHGYVAVALYVGFFLLAFLRARSRDPVQHWAKVSLGIGLLQIPIYGHLPTQLFVMITAAAVAAWPRDALSDNHREPPPP